MRMEMEAREREVKDGQRVVALISEQLKDKTIEYDKLEINYNKVSDILITFFINLVKIA